MITVCLPNSRALQLAAPLPDAVEVLTWDGSTPAPDGVERTEFWVVSHGSPYAEMIRAMPRLRVMQTTSAGIDHILGLVPPGVTLCDGRGIHGSAVSEWVLTVILAVLREIPGFLGSQERREWDEHVTNELSGRRVLIIGAGDLGTQTARRLRAFDAEPTMVARHSREGVHGRDELSRLLPEAEVVVLLVPITSETTHMVDAEFLARMRDGALLVNAARGPVVVTDALLAELGSRRLRAALDVTDPSRCRRAIRCGGHRICC